jgi:glycerol-3-phosphate dehydrogenase subunit B
MVDVLVIGGGLSGSIAALALRRGGAQVALSRRGWGASAAFNGAFDLALSPALSALGSAAPHGSQTPAAHVAPWTLEKHLDDIVSHQPLHPFGTLGATTALTHMASGYAVLQEVLAAAHLHASDLDVHAPCTLLPSSNGSLNPAPAMMRPTPAATPGPFGPGDGAPEQTWGVLNLADSGIALGPRTQAGWLHDAKQFGAPRPSLRQIAPSASSVGQYSGPFHLARHLDDLGQAQAFAQALARDTSGLAGIIVPAVLGLRQHRQVVALLEQVLGVPVLEALATMPSVPGVRLMLALEAALQREGVHLVSEVAQVTVQRQTFSHATTLAHGDVHAQACVLATGRFWTGGLIWERGARCQESLFGLPVLTSSGPLVERNAMEVTRRRPEEAQPLMTAGIGVDHRLRPLDVYGEPLTNVRAAGMVIGGFSPRYSRCADGVALTTAHHAAADLLQTGGGAPS